MKQNITYRGKQIKVDVPYKIRKGRCLCCGKKGFTSLHHWKYTYKIKEIRENKLLALRNTTELCYTCHEIGNSIRKVWESPLTIYWKLIKLRDENIQK